MEAVNRTRSFNNGTASSQVLKGEVGHSLTLDHLLHRFGTTVAIQEATLNIQPSEFVSLLGPSGCGKTTLLRLIAGFLTPVAGEILIDGQPVAKIPPNQRGVGIVFQNYALFPHMSVWDNVAYGLRARHTPKARITPKVGEMLELVQLSHLAKRYPSELSGGQQQRVALARALAVEPKLLLLDEPFSALDKNLRLDMQIEVRRLLSERGVTAILVTHDQEEALSMSDRIAVMSQGAIHQFDTPNQIYDHPATLFVSTFVGTCNLLPGRLMERDSSDCLVQVQGSGTLRIAEHPHLQSADDVTLAIRPENLRIQTEPHHHRLPGIVEMCLPLGSIMAYEVRIPPDTKLKVTQPRIAGTTFLERGQQIYLDLVSPKACSIFAKS